METLDVIVVGAGHAGLSTSYFLCKNQISHLVFERGKIGESWRSQRWDSFRLNTPNSVNKLPEEYTHSSDPDSFMSGPQFANYLKAYAEKNKLPVNENSKVLSIERNSDGGFFSITIEHDHHLQHYSAKQVVIASGGQNTFRIPGISKTLPKNIFQIHASEYRNAFQLPEGAVLVVGSAQSGCQVAEDLAENDKKVFLASSKVMRIPRRYRGKDITYWLTASKFFDVTTDSITDPQQLTVPPPQVSGVGKLGHTVSLQSLHAMGVRILGHLNNFLKDEFIFGDAKENVKFSDNGSQMVKSLIDDFIIKSGLDAPVNDPDPADEPDTECACAENLTSLNFEKNDITSVIWCTGFTGDFSWIKLPVLTPLGMPIHHNGIAPVKGLYFIGMPWLRTRKSAIIQGITDDAEAITNEIFTRVKLGDALIF